ncbi:MAG TPA: hypothetical protein VLG44_06190, partial [Chlamydiales bacterium]|nr:hypothetical protein [Chlamydiales bacterium]
IQELENRTQVKLAPACTDESLTDLIWTAEDALWTDYRSYSRKQQKRLPQKLMVFQEKVLCLFTNFLAFQVVTKDLLTKMDRIKESKIDVIDHLYSRGS